MTHNQAASRYLKVLDSIGVLREQALRREKLLVPPKLRNLLTSLFLVEQRLLPLPILYLSRHIIAHRADYYRLLLAGTREAAWEPWPLYMLRAVEDTAAWTTAKTAAVRKLAAETADHVHRRLPKIYSRELIDVIFEQPYCRIANVVESKIAGRQAASRYLKALGREKLFVHPKLVNLLTRDSNAWAPYT